MSSDTLLVNVRRRSRGTIISLPDGAELRSQCIRLGLAVGARFHCIERLPGGTIVVETGRQEIALGRSLAAGIGVTLHDSSPSVAGAAS